MNAFFAGIVFGALFMGAVSVIFITKARSPRREIAEWREENYQQPPVTTRILIKERNLEL
jgi:hypothetical protein